MHGALRILSVRALTSKVCWTKRVAFVDLKWSSSHVKMLRISFGGSMNENNSSSTSINTVSNISNNNGASNRHHFGTISGGGLSEDRRITFGYSSFQGKRATMEDFYDAKISKVDDQMVGLFGVFDGHGGSRAAEYLKHHLFDNLIKHPQFATDTKLALTETYQQTDSEFLKEESSIYRDDGSTASTAVLVGDRLYVANVGDSRAVILKAGEGDFTAMLLVLDVCWIPFYICSTQFSDVARVNLITSAMLPETVTDSAMLIDIILLE